VALGAAAAVAAGREQAVVWSGAQARAGVMSAPADAAAQVLSLGPLRTRRQPTGREVRSLRV